MIESWIPITLFAAFMQNLRSALQKRIKGRLSTGGAAYVRFLYALPLAVSYLAAVRYFGDAPLPDVNGRFLLYCLLGGVAQIVFTFLLIQLFSYRNFTVGTIYSKTEIIQVALLGLVLLGDRVGPTGIAAIAAGVVGIFVLSVAQTSLTWKNLATATFDKPALIGLASGAFLGASVVFFRGGALSLDGDSVLIRAALTLAVSLLMQTVIMGAYLKIREPGQLTAVLRAWRPALGVGVAGVLASIGWFTAFTLQNAAYVRAVGQVELIFTFIASVFFFKERTKPLELLGIALILAAIVVLVLAG